MLFQYRLRQRLNVLQVRNRMHRDLHNDVGSTLNRVKAYSDIRHEDPGNLLIADLIKENAGDMIERLEEISWATNPAHDSFISLKHKIDRYAIPLCAAKNIECNFYSDAISEQLIIPGEIRQNLFLVAKEAINNISKYSCASNCNVAATIESRKFTIEICDDGKGFDSAVKGAGHGIENMQARVEQIGGKFFISSMTDQGTHTKMEISYPFRIPKVSGGKRKR